MKNAVNLNLEKVNKNLYQIYTSTNKLIGTVSLQEDGFYYFNDIGCDAGSWSSHSLRMVADKLDEINKPYRNSIEEYFKNENKKRDSCEHDFELVFDFTNMESYLCKKCGYEKYSI